MVKVSVDTLVSVDSDSVVNVVEVDEVVGVVCNVVCTVVCTEVDDSGVSNSVVLVFSVVDSVLFVIIVCCVEKAVVSEGVELRVVDDVVGVLVVTDDVLVTSAGVSEVTVVV